MTRVLVLNSGSSSLRYRLFDGSEVLTKGLVQRIGESGGDAADHGAALRKLMDELDLTGLAAVGHRVVHGGERFTSSTVVDDGVLAAIEELIPLAPLHNPAALTGLRVARELLPDVPQVAVFDTAFHSTIPPAGRSPKRT
jgi:acetate kinase